MAQSGFTPIITYNSGTTTNVPTAGNLANGELALNYADGKLFYKDGSGNVQVIASKSGNVNVSSFSAGTTGFTPSTATTGAVTLSGTLVTTNGGTGLSTYTAGDLPYYASGTALSKLGIGSSGQILTSTGSAPQWSTLSGVAVTSFSAGTTGFTPSTATSGAITLSGTLATTNGGTGLTSFTANGVVYASSTSALATGSNLVFDGSNLGLGVTPKAWSSSYKAFQVGSQGSFWANASGNDIYLASNYYFDGSQKYIANGYASFYSQNNGAHNWQTAGNNVSGAGAIAAFTQAMTLDNSGRLMLGVTSAYANSKLTLIPTTTPTSGTNSYNQLVIGEATQNTSYYLNVGYINGSAGYGGSIQSIAGGSVARLMLNPSGGNVGIGTDNPNSLLTVKGANYNVANLDNNGSQYTNLSFSNNGTEKSAIYWDNTNTLFYLTAEATSSQMVFATSNAERMRIDSSGNLLVGTTTNIRTSKLVVGGAFGGGTGAEIDNTSNQAWIGLAWHTAGSLAGYVSVGTSTVSLVNGSDYRIKHNVQPMTDGLLKINSLNPVTFNWNIDASLGQGFIAHELQEIIPLAVFGEKDAVDEKGKIVPQGVDITAIIPTLVKAIQELNTLVTTQSAEIAALKQKVGI